MLSPFYFLELPPFVPQHPLGPSVTRGLIQAHVMLCCARRKFTLALLTAVSNGRRRELRPMIFGSAGDRADRAAAIQVSR